MKYNDMVEAVNKVIGQYSMSLTLRQIYYRLVVAELIPGTRAAYNGLSSQLVTARELGQVDENRIVDRSRRIEDPIYNSPEEFLEAAIYTVKNNWLRRLWITQEIYVEVWVEKDALSEVLNQAVNPVCTIVAPSRGYSSYSFIKDAAHRIDRYCSNTDGRLIKDALILHFADHDPSGIDMTRDLTHRLQKQYRGFCERRRVALSYDQVQEYHLVPNPTKLSDTRSPAYEEQYGAECWELDAIEPNELVRLCREAVVSEIQAPIEWEVLKAKEQSERETLLAKLKGMD